MCAKNSHTWEAEVGGSCIQRQPGLPNSINNYEINFTNDYCKIKYSKTVIAELCKFEALKWLTI